MKSFRKDVLPFGKLSGVLLMVAMAGVLMAGINTRCSAGDGRSIEDGVTYSSTNIPVPANPVSRQREVEDDEGGYKLRYWVVDCNDSDLKAIVGLHQLLYKVYRGDAVRNKHESGAAFQRVRIDVDRCTQLNFSRNPRIAFDTSWSATLDLTFDFYLKRSERLGMEMSNGYAAVIDGVKTSALTRRFDCYVDWDSKNKKLYVQMADYDDATDTGTQHESGFYNVTAKSTTSTLSSKSSVSSSYSKETTDGVTEQTISLAASHYSDANKRRIKVNVGGASYMANFGNFAAIERVRSDGIRELDFLFSARWLTDCDLSYTETADYSDVQCKNSKKFDGSLTFIDRITGASASAQWETNCLASRTQLPMRITWRATPTIDNDTASDEGLTSSLRLATLGGTTSQAWYQARFGNRMTWRINAVPTESSGGVIDITNLGTGDHESKAHYLTNY